MQPEKRDAAYLWNVAEAGRRIQEFTSGLTFKEYVEHASLPSAVERQFEILGEEARKLSTSFRSEHPEIPWRSIIRETASCYGSNPKSDPAIATDGR